MTTTSNQPNTERRVGITPEEFMRRREQGMALFHALPDDELNVEAITTLIDWAEADEERRASVYASWGSWRQGLWGLASTASDNMRTLLNRGEGSQVGEEVAEMGKNGACGTAFCMAGQAVVQAGYVLDYDSEASEWDNGTVGVSAENCVWTEPSATEVTRWGTPVLQEVGDPVDIAETATEILGLTDEEADLFFAGSNTIRHLKMYLNRFCEDRGMDHVYPGSGVYR